MDSPIVHLWINMGHWTVQAGLCIPMTLHHHISMGQICVLNVALDVFQECCMQGLFDKSSTAVKKYLDYLIILAHGLFHDHICEVCKEVQHLYDNQLQVHDNQLQQ